MTGGDVAYRIAAGLASGQPVLCQILKALRDILDFDIMKLDVLPGGDVQNPVGIVFPEIRQTVELVRSDAAKGQFGANHLHVFLPLSVNTLLQAETFEILFAHLTFLKPLYFGGKVFDFLFDLRREV